MSVNASAACLFCEISSDHAEASVVASDEVVVAFLDAPLPLGMCSSSPSATFPRWVTSNRTKALLCGQ